MTTKLVRDVRQLMLSRNLLSSVTSYLFSPLLLSVGRSQGDIECVLLSHAAPTTAGDADPLLHGDYWTQSPDFSDYRFLQVKNPAQWKPQGCTFVPASPPARGAPMEVCGFAGAVR